MAMTFHLAGTNPPPTAAETAEIQKSCAAKAVAILTKKLTKAELVQFHANVLAAGPHFEDAVTAKVGTGAIVTKAKVASHAA